MVIEVTGWRCGGDERSELATADMLVSPYSLTSRSLDPERHVCCCPDRLTIFNIFKVQVENRKSIAKTRQIIAAQAARLTFICLVFSAVASVMLAASVNRISITEAAAVITEAKPRRTRPSNEVRWSRTARKLKIIFIFHFQIILSFSAVTLSPTTSPQ